MIVLLVIGVVLAGLLLWYGLSRFERYVQQKYGHRFFTVRVFLLAVLALCFVLAGQWWWQLAQESGGDVLNGLLLVTIGAVIAISIIVRNVWRTSFLVGISGSVLQVSVFAPLLYFGTIALAVGLALSFVAALLVAMTATPVYVVNRW